MTLRDRVARTSRTLAAVAVWRSVLLGASGGAAILAVAWPFTAGPGRSAAIALALAAGGALSWWSYRRLSDAGFTVESVALWIEERIPSLGYGLVTAVERGAPPGVERAVAAVDWAPVTRDAAKRALLAPVIGVMAAVALLAVSMTMAPAISRLANRASPGPRAVAGPLDVTVRVEPPAYARRRAESLRNPSVVRALVGSVLHVSGDGRDSMMLRAGDQESRADQPWRVGARPVALQVSAGSSSRLIAIDPVPDSAPAVQLQAPQRDTVLATPEGTFALGAGVRDDLGIRRVAFEYIVSSGSGESFTFASGTIAARPVEGARTATLNGQLSLSALELKPGDFVHLRAVATDWRDDTAAARGASETRTIRIARTGEYDPVSVEAAAPPEADKAVLSQRMLINLTEALVRRRTRLDRETFGDETRNISRDQARLRRQVGDLVFARLGGDSSAEHGSEEQRAAMTPEELLKAAENATTDAAGHVLDFHGDETPVVAVNRPLLEAYNFMWEAGRELDQVAPERALPAMYRALEAIQRARAAERIYLRSRPPRAVVDVDRVRLQGKEKGTPAAREPRSPAAAVGRADLARFARLVALARTDPAAASDSMLVLRIDLLGNLPAPAAAAAADAAHALRNGRDATGSLATFRRSLGPGVAATDSLSRWRGAR